MPLLINPVAKPLAFLLTSRHRQSPDGRVTQGYFITAYRNLTSVGIPVTPLDNIGL